jgi:hypothetical protein
MLRATGLSGIHVRGIPWAAISASVSAIRRGSVSIELRMFMAPAERTAAQAAVAPLVVFS